MRNAKAICIILFPLLLLVSVYGCKKMEWDDEEEDSFSDNVRKDITYVDGLRVGSQTYPYLPSDIAKGLLQLESNEGYLVDREDVWVCGYVVGYVNGTRMKSFVNGTGDKETNVVLADGCERWDLSLLFPVQLSKSPVACGKVRDMLNLSLHPENLFRRVKVKGNIESYMGVWGMKNTSDVFLVE